MGMRSRTVWHSMFSAHDAEFEHFSPGVLLFIEMARSADDLGVTCVDLGKGGSAGKRRLANRKVAVAERRVELESLKPSGPDREKVRRCAPRVTDGGSLQQAYRKYRDR